MTSQGVSASDTIGELDTSHAEEHISKIHNLKFNID
jgi:hypothetical protein